MKFHRICREVSHRQPNLKNDIPLYLCQNLSSFFYQVPNKQVQCQPHRVLLRLRRLPAQQGEQKTKKTPANRPELMLLNLRVAPLQASDTPKRGIYAVTDQRLERVQALEHITRAVARGLPPWGARSRGGRRSARPRAPPPGRAAWRRRGRSAPRRVALPRRRGADGLILRPGHHQSAAPLSGGGGGRRAVVGLRRGGSVHGQNAMTRKGRYG